MSRLVPIAGSIAGNVASPLSTQAADAPPASAAPTAGVTDATGSAPDARSASVGGDDCTHPEDELADLSSGRSCLACGHIVTPAPVWEGKDWDDRPAPRGRVVRELFRAFVYHYGDLVVRDLNDHDQDGDCRSHGGCCFCSEDGCCCCGSPEVL